MAWSSWLAILLLACGAYAAAAADAFTLEDYRRMKATDPATLEMVLGAMYETAAYAQASIEHPVLCYSPVPLAGVDLVTMVDAEVAEPTGAIAPVYNDDDHVSLILINALKSQGICR